MLKEETNLKKLVGFKCLDERSSQARSDARLPHQLTFQLLPQTMSIRCQLLLLLNRQARNILHFISTHNRRRQLRSHTGFRSIPNFIFHFNFIFVITFVFVFNFIVGFIKYDLGGIGNGGGKGAREGKGCGGSERAVMVRRFASE